MVEFTTLKESLLANFFMQFFPSTQHLVKVPREIYIPNTLLELLAHKKSFVVLHDIQYTNLILYGNPKQLIPRFEMSLREIFQGKPYGKEFSSFFFDIVKLIVSNTGFRKQLSELLATYDDSFELDDTKAHKISA